MYLMRRVDLWLPPLLLMAVIFYLSDQPDLDSGLGWIDTVGRKLVHFASYGLLCLLWWRFLRHATSRSRAALVAFLITTLYAAGDEYHQSFVAGRHGSPIDWAIDTAGAALVALRIRGRERATA